MNCNNRSQIYGAGHFFCKSLLNFPVVLINSKVSSLKSSSPICEQLKCDLSSSLRCQVLISKNTETSQGDKDTEQLFQYFSSSTWSSSCRPWLCKHWTSCEIPLTDALSAFTSLKFSFPLDFHRKRVQRSVLSGFAPSDAACCYTGSVFEVQQRSWAQLKRRTALWLFCDFGVLTLCCNAMKYIYFVTVFP